MKFFALSLDGVLMCCLYLSAYSNSDLPPETLNRTIELSCNDQGNESVNENCRTTLSAVSASTETVTQELSTSLPISTTSLDGSISTCPPNGCNSETEHQSNHSETESINETTQPVTSPVPSTDNEIFSTFKSEISQQFTTNVPSLNDETIPVTEAENSTRIPFINLPKNSSNIMDVTSNTETTQFQSTDMETTQHSPTNTMQVSIADEKTTQFPVVSIETTQFSNTSVEITQFSNTSVETTQFSNTNIEITQSSDISAETTQFPVIDVNITESPAENISIMQTTSKDIAIDITSSIINTSMFYPTNITEYSTEENTSTDSSQMENFTLKMDSTTKLTKQPLLFDTSTAVPENTSEIQTLLPDVSQNISKETTETSLSDSTITDFLNITEDERILNISVPIMSTNITPVLEISTIPINNVSTLTISDTSTVSPEKMYITVEVKINCSENHLEKVIPSSLADFLNTTLKDPEAKQCKIYQNITMLAPPGLVNSSAISQFLTDKSNSNVQLIRIIYDSENMNKTKIKIAESTVSQTELILYISLGVCLGIIILIALFATCFKCFRRKPSKPLDLDVPHLNLRLEDYTLTRIPRPNTTYMDYFRGSIINDRYSSAPLSNSLNAHNTDNRGLVQPFDTSVVPLEDAKKLDEMHSVSERNLSNCPPTPLRTFGRKDWRGENLIYENIMSSSTEKLHPDFFKAGNRGMENPTFAA